MISAEELLRKRTALIVVDVQNEFCSSEGSFAKKGMDVSSVNKIMPPLYQLIDAAHAHHCPVIFIQNTEDESTDCDAWLSRPDGDENKPNEGVTRRGTWGAELYELKPAADDVVVEKHRFSAFYNTRLETVLKAYKIETVIITGLATNVCVMTTATHAVMYGYHVVVAEDACAAWFQDVHEMALKNLRLFVGKVLKTAEIIKLLK